MSIRSKLAAVGLAATVATTSVVAMAPKAEASLPWCNGVSTVWFNGKKTAQPTYYGSPNCVLSIGSSGIAVKNLQVILNICLNHEGLAVDGVFGPHTRDVLKAYQAIYGLTPDGVYGPKTRARLPQTVDWVISGSYRGAQCTWAANW